MIFVWIAVALAALYLIFIVGPAIVAFFKVFERKDCPPLEELDLTKYGPAADVMLERCARMRGEASEELSVTAFDGTELRARLYARGNSRLAVLARTGTARPSTIRTVWNRKSSIILRN